MKLNKHILTFIVLITCISAAEANSSCEPEIQADDVIVVIPISDHRVPHSNTRVSPAGQPNSKYLVSGQTLRASKNESWPIIDEGAAGRADFSGYRNVSFHNSRSSDVLLREGENYRFRVVDQNTAKYTITIESLRSGDSYEIECFGSMCQLGTFIKHEGDELQEVFVERNGSLIETRDCISPAGAEIEILPTESGDEGSSIP